MYRDKFAQKITAAVSRLALNPRRGLGAASGLTLVVVSLLATLMPAGRAAAQTLCPNARDFGVRTMASRREGEKSSSLPRRTKSCSQPASSKQEILVDEEVAIPGA